MNNKNAYYILTVIVIAAGGIPKGYDEGGFSGSVGLKSFQTDYNLLKKNWENDPSGLASRTANVTSFGVLGAAFGAIFSLTVTDRFGRLRCWQLFICTWAVGLLMQVFSSGIYGFILFSRLFSGLGAGGLTVTAPLYLSEIAPSKSRGMIVSIYMVILLSFLTLGFFINYAANARMAITRTQYRLVQSIPLIPTGLALIGSLFLSDTPRWLASKDRTEEATRSLTRLRSVGSSDDPRIAEELEEILSNCRVKEQQLKEASAWTIMKEIAAVPSFRKRFLLGLFMQTVAQWSGGNGITYYIPQIFEYAGVKSQNSSLISSGAYGVVKLVFTMVFTWTMVDIIGRRKCLIAGLSLQCITHVYMAIYMAIWKEAENKPASDAAIASVFVYAVGWSIGLCTVQYLYGTEIYPTRIRSVCYAANMAFHWFFQFAVVRVTPNMFVSLNIYGAYIFWALICATGLLLLGLMAPETKGIPMERMEDLFDCPWWMGWKAKSDLKTTHAREETLKDDVKVTETKTHTERLDNK